MQWAAIENSANSDDAMRVFVDQTRSHFKEKLDSYILPESKQIDIDIDDLSNYTSATHSDKKCNLVKCVELYTPLSFLEEGIEIVDTPGLDDIVIQREEITKEYLAKCDVMLHLMNVSQSATSKDVEFIIDAVLYQNITKVLVVITRIDMVSRENVEEVIEYTKRSISKKLHEQNEESKLDFILKTIDFVAISGKMALLHKTGESKKALSAGYTLEESGIVDIENYLEDTIFGKENSRSSLIIRSAKNRLVNVLNATVKELKYEISLLFKSEDELQAELDTLKQKKEKQLGTLKNLKQQIAGYEVEVSTYVEGLQYFLTNELKTLQSIIKQRLMDEVYYSLEKNKKTPSLKDQTRIIQTALKHGIIDIIREYRYKFIQKSSKVLETINLQYDEIEGSTNDTHEEFDYQSVFGDAFNQGFLTSNNSALIDKIAKVVDGAKASNLTKIGNSVVAIIKDEFVYLEQQVKAKALEVSKALLDEFFISLKEPIKTIENKLDHDEKVLEEHISFLDQSEVSSHDRSIKLHDQIKKIEQISKRYSL
jgi:signal recognition particle receptor subunit beta